MFKKLVFISILSLLAGKTFAAESPTVEVSGSCKALQIQVEYFNNGLAQNPKLELKCRDVTQSFAEFRSTSMAQLKFGSKETCDNDLVKMVKLKRNEGPTVPFKTFRALLETIGIKIVYVRDQVADDEVAIIPSCLL